jgi:hypothetical protein
MDVRRDGWFGQLLLSGSASPKAHRGSIMGIIAESLKDISASRSRSEDSEIVLRLSRKPFTSDSAHQMEKAFEVESLVSGDADQPQENESFEDFYSRLISGGYTVAAAEMIAAEWFQREPNRRAVAWLHDPMAVRFRELNTRHEAYEAAMPNEYESLKHYVVTEYPEFTSHMIFRTA